MLTGLVLRVDAKVCHVEADGVVHRLPLRGKLFEHRTHEKQPVAAGDRVRITLDAAGGAIEERLPRTSQLTRKASGADEREQVIAANVTLVLVTASLAEPAFRSDVVDKVLAGAERESLTAVLVLTKLDRDRRGERARWQPVYEAIGYRVFATSIAEGRRTGDALAALRALLAENITVLSGMSGVGKSSLINSLVPGLDLRVGDVGKARAGRHTTTHTQLVPLPGGGHVLDTPGIRNFGLADTGPRDIGWCFREFQPLLRSCSYNDCLHRNEPGCAVRAALARGEIAESRWRSYCILLDETMTDR